MLGPKKILALALFGIAIFGVWMDAAQRGGRGQRGAPEGPPPVTGLTVTGEVQNLFALPGK